MLQVVSEKAEQDITITAKKADITGVPTFKSSHSKLISSEFVTSDKVRVAVTMVMYYTTCY